jgi:hypothetical protein
MFRIAMSFVSCFLLSNLAFASEEGATATANQQYPALTATAFQVALIPLEAKGPGALFSSIEAAAIDALTHAYLQAQDACDLEYMRGGTIHPVGGDHYSYGEIHRANRWNLHRISYSLKPQDVARFHLYPVSRDTAINRINERPSRVDLRSVRAVDPLHRPLYILHPSLAVRAYGGKGSDFIEVASLRRPARPRFLAGKCSTQAPSVGNLTGSSRIAEVGRPASSY